MKNKMIAIAFATSALVATAMFGGAVHAETISSIDGNVVTLDNGDQYVVDGTSGMSVGDDVDVVRDNVVGDDVDTGDVTGINDSSSGDDCEAEAY